VTELVPAADVVVDGELVDDQHAEIDELIEEWIDSKPSQNTRTAYRGDIQAWRDWCARHGVHLLRARKSDVERWHREYAENPTAKTGRPPKPATVARKVAAVSSFYERLVDLDIVGMVPVRSSSRPRAPKKSSTVGLSATETVLLRDQAAAAGPLEHAMVEILVGVGMRVAELTGLTVKDYRWKQGRRTLVVVRKGDKEQELPVDQDMRTAIDAWLAVLCQRLMLATPAGLDGDSPLFPNIAGGHYTQRSIQRMVQRLAKGAGIESWSRLSPHSLRHTAATNLLAAGVPIHVVQEILGHEHVSTTQRYDRDRGEFERSVVGQLSLRQYLAGVREQMQAAA
jgi:integrase/recombinase XerD